MSQSDLVRELRKHRLALEEELQSIATLLARYEHVGGGEVTVAPPPPAPRKRGPRAKTAPTATRADGRSRRGSPGSPSVVIDALITRVGRPNMDEIVGEVRAVSTTSSKDVRSLVYAILSNKDKYAKDAEGKWGFKAADEDAQAEPVSPPRATAVDPDWQD